MTQPALSVQLYTVRDQLDADLDGTLARLAGMGLTQVEPYGFVGRAPELAVAFARLGLSAKTGHAGYLSDQPQTLGEIFEAATLLGIELVIDPFVAPERWLDQDSIAETARRLNAAAVVAAEQGLRVGYHNHTQEFQRTFDGVSGFDYFVGLLRDDVDLEIDLYWAATAGIDVPALLSRLGSRVKALHVKDGILGPDPFSGDADAFAGQSMDQRPAGTGEVPLLDYLAAAPSTEFAVIEFDTYDKDIFEGIAESVAFFNGNGIQ